jgi:hypothetical protein
MRLQHRSFFYAVLTGLLAAGALLALSSNARADVPYPIRIAVIFEQAGQPYNGPVRFTITCYGYSYPVGPDPERAPGSYTPAPVYSLSGDCAGYGCTVDEDLYLNYRHLDSCDLEGNASGVRFLVKNYARTPIDLRACGSPSNSDYRWPCELRIAIPEDVALLAVPQGTAGPTGQIATPEDVALPAISQGIAGPTGRSYVAAFLIALVVTLLVELPVLWALARGVFKLTAVSTRRLLAVGAVGSLLTLPVLWFVLPAFLNPPVAVVLGETLAVGVEALLYSRLLPARPLVALALSFATNLGSFTAGLLVF